MKRFTLVSVATCLMAQCSGYLAAADTDGHCFGEWPAINAMLPDAKQHNLNPETQDFLIEVWFKPLSKVPHKSGDVNTLVSKRLWGGLTGFELGYRFNGDVYFSVCDADRELEGDVGAGAACGLKEGQWYYVAAARAGNSLRLYKDGVPAGNVACDKLGSISNQDMFSVSLCSYGTQAHCQIKEVRFWRMKKGYKADFDKAVAEHQRDTEKLADALTANADYSRWTFVAAGETVKDLGNNGNDLMYVPLGYHAKDVIPIKPFPEKPVGTTYYVDIANPAAADTNPGGQDKPFLTIRRGLKALRPGDVLHICKGRYFVKDVLSLPRGENGKPVTVEGEEGTVLVGAEPITGWTKTDNGIWVVKEWKGNYYPPSDVREWDARSHPGNILFAGDDFMDYVTTKADLAPGCWTVEPVEGVGPKTIYLCPPPGVDPGAAKMEIVASPGFLYPSEFNHIRNLHLTRGGSGIATGGRGIVIENNRIDRLAGAALNFWGQDITVRNNQIEWTGGICGACTRVRFEKNTVRFNAWRIMDGGWGGGAVKLIPACIDHVMTGNEFAYNRTATVWYDSGNQGIVLENNVMHDNQAGGIFDEFGFGNTFRNNLIYNNGNAMVLGNSCSDKVEGNVCFNNLSGIFLRGASYDKHKETDAAKIKKDADDWMFYCNTRRRQGMITYEREKYYRDMSYKYISEYTNPEICRHNTFAGNVIFDNGLCDFTTAIGRYPYGQPGVTVDPDAVNEYRDNYYGSSSRLGAEVAQKGAADLAAWQKASGQETGSVWVNPWDKEKMPKWYQEKMAKFTEERFRPYKEIVDLTGGEVRKFSPSRLLLRGRLAESKVLKVVEFEDSGVRGAYFDTEGKHCLALWSRGGAGMTDWILPAGQKEVVVENKWLNRTTVKADDGRLSLYVTDDQTVLIGVDGEVQEDRSVVIRVPQYTEPGKPVVAAISLENQGQTPQACALAVHWADGFEGNVNELNEKVAPGAKTKKTLTLTPKAGTGKGAYQLVVEGTVGERKVKKTKGFILGTRNEAPKRHISVDGDASDWDAVKIPAEVADSKDQVLLGKDAWRGPADLSAKARVAWDDDYVMSVIVEVTDDKLVTNHRKDKPTASDSVQLFVDVRTPWKLYENAYGTGTFQLMIVPASDDSKDPTVEFIGAPIAHTHKVATKKTDKGYNVEVYLRFRNMDEPGWVAGREFRVGVLVNDSDDPAARLVESPVATGLKSTLGLWRTALDADKNCVSLTRFTLQK